MSAILKTFVDHMIHSKPTWWVILDCDHWYHWTGDKAPKADGDFPCPSCKPEPTIEPFPSVGAQAQTK